MKIIDICSVADRCYINHFNATERMLGNMKKFLKGVRGKQVLVSVLAIMVIAAGYYRWASEREKSTMVTNEVLPVDVEQNATTEDNDYFARARYERDCARSESIELLSVSTSSNEEKSALDEKIALQIKDAENEAIIETMVMAEGYSDCVAFVDEEGVKVIVKAENLDAEKVSEIKNIIVKQTGEKPTKIKVSNKK